MRKTTTTLALILGLSAWNAMAQVEEDQPQRGERPSRQARARLDDQKGRGERRQSRVENPDRIQQERVNPRRDISQRERPEASRERPGLGRLRVAQEDDQRIAPGERRRTLTSPPRGPQPSPSRPNFCPNCGCDLRPMISARWNLEGPQREAPVRGFGVRPRRSAADLNRAPESRSQLRPPTPGDPELEKKDRSIERRRPAAGSEDRRPARRQPADDNDNEAERE